MALVGRIFYTATRKGANAVVVEGADLFPGRVTARPSQAPTTLNLPLSTGPPQHHTDVAGMSLNLQSVK